MCVYIIFIQSAEAEEEERIHIVVVVVWDKSDKTNKSLDEVECEWEHVYNHSRLYIYSW